MRIAVGVVISRPQTALAMFRIIGFLCPLDAACDPLRSA